MNYTFYVGTYSKENSKGIYLCKFNNEVKEKVFTYNLLNPSYVTVCNKNLYAVIESKSYNGNVGGALASFKINENYELSPLNIVPTFGEDPCHVTLTKDGAYAVTANYSGGSFSTFKANKDGSLNYLKTIKHFGCSKNKARQEASHVHFAKFSPCEKYLCIVDLGLDKLFIYDFNKETGEVSLNKELTLSIEGGSGPRHLVFHPFLNFIYLVTELTSEIVVLSYDFNEKKLEKAQTISSLPINFNGESYASAIKISKDGKFIYVSNRGDDSIGVFKIDFTTGKLTLINHYKTYGSYPRDFSITPDGRYLYAANEKSNSITIFSIDSRTGALEKCTETIEIPSPVCINFIY